MNAPRELTPPVVIHDRIERLPISALVPYARNSRTHSDEQLAQIAASMREFGFTNPVLIDEFVWFLSSEDLPTRRLAGASFDRGTFSNVFEHATASGHKASIHGAVFPVGVATHFIGGLSQTGASVYEPFCGSGTTLIAAEQLDRKCYGMELDPKYCDVIVRRWQDFTGQQATLEATGQTFDEVSAGA